jgi:hypothetical protein
LHRPPARRYTWDHMDADKRGNLFKELNVDLRMLPSTTGDEHKCLKALWAPFIINILSGMAKLPKVQPRHVTAWRGRPESMRELRQIYMPGRLVTWSAFTSCSKRLDNAAYMANWDQGCVLQLMLAEVTDISGLSFFPNEEEVLLPPNSQFVVGVETTVESVTASDGQTFLVKIITLQQVATDGVPLIS